jgi:hypothetical protein
MHIRRPFMGATIMEVVRMIDEMQSIRELEPIRMRTMVLAQIEHLSDERRQLLSTLTRFDDSRATRRRLNEINDQLDTLWKVRRRELR